MVFDRSRNIRQAHGSSVEASAQPPGDAFLRGREFQDATDQPVIAEQLASSFLYGCYLRGCTERLLNSCQTTDLTFHVCAGALALSSTETNLVHVPAIPLAIVRHLSEGNVQLEWSFYDGELQSHLSESVLRCLQEIAVKIELSHLAETLGTRSKARVNPMFDPGFEYVSLVCQQLDPSLCPIYVQDKDKRLGEGLWVVVERSALSNVGATQGTQSTTQQATTLDVYKNIWSHYGLCAESLGEQLPRSIDGLARALELQVAPDVIPGVGRSLILSEQTPNSQPIVCPIEIPNGHSARELRPHWLHHCVSR